MSEFQTSVQDLGAILRGSGKIELSAVLATPSWTDLGAISGLDREELLEVNSEENDNADSEDVVTSQEVKVMFNMHEPLKLTVHKLLRESLDTFTDVAAAKVEDHDQTVASGDWAWNEFIQCEYQNADGTVLQIDAQGYPDVSGSVDGALVHGTDYFIVKDDQGDWGIIVIDSATVTTESQILTISYDYTPNASTTIQSGDKTTMQKFMIRITTTNGGNTYQFIGYYCNITKGFKYTHPKDDDPDRRVKLPIELICKVLPTGSGAAANAGLVYQTYQTSGLT